MGDAWPTPDARDRNSEGIGAAQRRLEMYSTVGLQGAVNLWPTPTSRDHKDSPGQTPRGGKHGREGIGVAVQQSALWPTPSAMNPNDGEGLATWEARRQRVKAEKKNGNGFGTPLAIAIQLWPTPTANDAGNATAPPSQALRHTPGLATQVARAWPTPTANGEILSKTPTPGMAHRVGRKGFSNILEAVARELWPTPRAGDGPKGGPNQRGSSGDLMLPSAVQGPVPGQLNPAWVEILQGLPVGWTDLDVPNDALATWPGWPSAPGEEQGAWEPSRTGTGIPQRSKRLECLGNACVPQQAALLFAAIADVDAELVALAAGTAAQDARGRL